MAQYVTFEYKDGSKYCGESESSTLHGCGLLVEPSNKGAFEGLWVKGSRMSGTYTWSHGKQYAGDWKGPFRNGLGVETRKDGTKYSGEYSQNTMGPLGVLTLPTHGLYLGMWSSTGVQEGHGVEAYADGGFYRGQYKNGLRSGYGTRSSAGYEKRQKEAFADLNRKVKVQPSIASIASLQTLKKNLPEGNSADNIHEGVSWNQLYVGQWANDKRCGYGVLKVSDYFTYYGQWKENTRTGYGVLIYEGQKDKNKGGKGEEIKEEGLWDNGKLVETFKKKLMKSELQDKVKEAHAEAIEAATQARDRAKVAEAKANAAAAKSKVAESRALEARQHAECACKGVENAVRIAEQSLQETYKIKGGVRIVIDEAHSEMSTKLRSGSLDISYQQLAAENEVSNNQPGQNGKSITQASSFHNIQGCQP